MALGRALTNSFHTTIISRSDTDSTITYVVELISVITLSYKV